MNKERKNRLTEILAEVSIIRKKIESIKSEKEEAFDNLPDNLRESEKGEIMDSNIGTLDEIYSLLEEINDNFIKLNQKYDIRTKVNSKI